MTERLTHTLTIIIIFNLPYVPEIMPRTLYIFSSMSLPTII